MEIFGISWYHCLKRKINYKRKILEASVLSVMEKKYQDFLLIKPKYINFNKNSTNKKVHLISKKYVKRENKIKIMELNCYSLYKNKFISAKPL